MQLRENLFTAPGRREGENVLNLAPHSPYVKNCRDSRSSRKRRAELHEGGVVEAAEAKGVGRVHPTTRPLAGVSTEE